MNRKTGAEAVPVPYDAVRKVLREEIEISKNGGERWTTETLAIAVGVQTGTVSSWKQGRRAPKPAGIRKLAEILYPDDVQARDNFIRRISDARTKGEYEPPPFHNKSAKKFLMYHPDGVGESVVQFAGIKDVRVEEENGTTTIRFRH